MAINQPDPDTDPLPPKISYHIGIVITKINNVAPVPNMDVIGKDITIEGTASATRIYTDTRTNKVVQEEDVISSLDGVFLSFDNGSTRIQASTGTGWKTWSLSVPRPKGNANADGQITILAIAQYAVGVLGKTSATVRIDINPPVLAILKPLDDATVPVIGASATVELIVTVSDIDKGTKVSWSLDNGLAQAIALSPEGKGTADISVAKIGKHTIKILAMDTAGNITEEVRTVEVVPPFAPVDTADLTGPISYLADLLEFAGKWISVGVGDTAASGLPSAADFSATFCQRFSELVNSENRAVSLLNMHQSRIAVDVLRQYLLKRVPQWRDHPDQLVASESGYRHQAYAALLTYLGTSAEELRRALIGDETGRLALADRLGVGAGAVEGLLLAPSAVSDAALERIFGLADTHFMRDPFARNASPPDLLIKRRAYQRAAWRQQDTAVRHPLFDLPVPVIDPDLLLPGDLQSTTATLLFEARRLQVQNLIKALRDLPGTGQAKFEGALDFALKAGAVAKFNELAEKYQAGADIEFQLKELYMDPAAFLYLAQLHALLKAGGEPIADEWEQTYSILAQIQKLRDAYTVWRAQEVEKAIVLGPDDFNPRLLASVSPDLPDWRASFTARQAWTARLSARVDQDRALLQQLNTLVDSAEAVALPVLRDHLLGLIRQAANSGPDRDTAEELTAELFLDFKASNLQKLSPVEQAIETLQGILFALRTGRLASVRAVAGTNLASGWKLVTSAATFDEEWQWMGSHAAWRSAMGIFLFPENFLQPASRPSVPAVPGQTVAFQNLVARLRGSLRITREEARTIARDYFGQLLTQIPSEVTQNDPLGKAVRDALSSFSYQEPTSDGQIEALRAKINAAIQSVSGNPQEFNGVEYRLQEVFYFVPLLLAQQLKRSGEYQAALDWFRAVYAYTLPKGPDRKVYRGLLLEEDDPNDFVRTPGWLSEDFNPHKVAQNRRNVYTRYTLMSLVQCLLAFADDQFTKQTDESIPEARALYLESLDLLDLPEMKTSAQFEGKLLENALLQSLRDHAAMNLLKLRNGLNIAGLELPPRSSFGIRSVTRRPTAYRYQVLIERAKQLSATAGQIEAGFLAALEKRDSENYTVFKARQDLDLSQAQVDLQKMRVSESQDGVQLVQIQQDRTHIQVEYYHGLLREGLLPAERSQLRSLKNASRSSFWGGLAQLGTVGLGLVSGGTTVLGLGAAAGVAGLPTLTGGFLSIASRIAGTFGNSASTNAQVQSLQASFERREQEWKQQLSLARQDLVIGDQQIKLAEDRTAIIKQEAKIASIQLDHTEQTLNFLANKFTNAELFDWMSQVLERVYAFFLQQATAIAKLAEIQLGFERQEVLPRFIQADYWQALDAGSADQSPNRRGLTGSARLLQSVTELDQYAFVNDRRKLQISKTFSLAALSPFEFQRFRETGVLPFSTVMEQFDRDFPGHYLRLIKQVRTTVLALIPPTVGIHATLTNLGVSRVTINDGGFQDVEVHHGPQTVALAAPVNATGVFELNQQPEFLLPFEAIGVDSFWEFQLPKPANPFDFDTIADVLVTVDYTALDSQDYRRHVVQRLDPAISADLAFSFRNQFADQWYDLNHPEQSATPSVVSFKTERGDFPPNLQDLRIQQVVLYFVLKDGVNLNIPVTYLRFTEQGTTAFVGGGATALGGVVSTRRGNTTQWAAILGKSPIGEWELALTDRLADGRETKALFDENTIDDVLFVITYSGRTPDWPT